MALESRPSGLGQDQFAVGDPAQGVHEQAGLDGPHARLDLLDRIVGADLDLPLGVHRAGGIILLHQMEAGASQSIA
jgi:hypothetical protein